MGFSVIEKGIGYSGEYIYKKSSGTGRTESVSAKSYFRQLQESSGEKANSAGQASVMELYETMRRFRTMTETEMPETKTPEEASEPEPASCLSEEQEEEDSRTDTEIIVKPDGSRVLVVTMNVGGTETSMTLKISEPTAMPNDNRTAETAAELPQPQTESES